MYNTDKNIWWLASYPKSGNTWVRAFLESYLTGNLDINAMRAVVGDLNEYYHQIVSPFPLTEYNMRTFLCIHTAAMLHLTVVQGQDPLIVKTHNANLQVDRMTMLAPILTNGAIYIIRDPRDVAISWAEHLGFDIDTIITKMADEKFLVHNDNNQVNVLTSWSSHVKSFTRDELDFKVGVLHYEDILADPIGKFTGVLKYLGIDAIPERVEEATKACSFKNLKAQEEEKGFLERKHQDQFFKRGTSGGWRKILTEEQVSRIEKDHGEVMKKHGYELVLEDKQVA